MSFPIAALTISAGVIIWALHFTAIYGFTALACARGWSGAVVPLNAAASALAAAAVLAVIATGWRRRESFEHWLSAAIGAAALVAIVYESAPLLIVAPCR